MAHPSSPPLPANSSPESSLLVLLLPPEHRRRNRGGAPGACAPPRFINCYINCSLLYVWFQTVPPHSTSLSYAEEEEEEDEEGVLSPAELVSAWLVVGRRSAAFCMCACV